MTPGIGFPSFASLATWSGSGWDSLYPASNVGDLVLLTKVARAAATGSVTLKFDLSSAQAVQFLALANHNLSSSATMRVRLFSGAGQSGSTLADTGTVTAWATPALGADGSPRYAQTRPVLFNAPVTALSGQIDLSDTTKVEVGGVEISGWWSWRGISLGRETGIDSQETSVQLAGGGFAIPKEYVGRVVNGAIDYVLLANTNSVLDFQAGTDLEVPFCFVMDSSDPTSWARLCLMATNSQLPPLAAAAYRADKFAFQFTEHLR